MIFFDKYSLSIKGLGLVLGIDLHETGYQDP